MNKKEKSIRLLKTIFNWLFISKSLQTRNVLYAGSVTTRIPDPVYYTRMQTRYVLYAGSVTTRIPLACKFIMYSYAGPVYILAYSSLTIILSDSPVSCPLGLERVVFIQTKQLAKDDLGQMKPLVFAYTLSRVDMRWKMVEIMSVGCFSTLTPLVVTVRSLLFSVLGVTSSSQNVNAVKLNTSERCVAILLRRIHLVTHRGNV